ncbi:hypothetical protein BH11PLA2_BH11PLA2_30360 [soil metagenome]
MISALRIKPMAAPVVIVRPSLSLRRPVAPRGTASDLAWTVVDYSAAAIGLVLVTPLILLAMLAMRISSRGPAIYTQTRLGRGGRTFTLYKIRTMCHEAESLTGPRWSLPGDPRITPMGQWLRKLHLDELPQLWNVLRGEMSLVGPRPERPEIAAELRKVISGYDRRLSVKPGLTGIAQIHLPPDETISDVKTKLVYDRFGIAHRGVAFHFGIVIATALKVVGLKRFYRRSSR